ncbi:hypothetical protein [Magnetococcus marinus]|uniref:hypothetical protein n=1 Tax=Magnetococcus marinus TaxID=1124597 RepID=UPI00003C5837|nr:hypothetical protein [Magnetococcus marinus]
MIFATLLLNPLFGLPFAGEQEDRRLSVALKLFPSFLSADPQLAHKKNAKGQLHLLILYSNRLNQAMDLAKGLQSREKLRGLPLLVEAVALSDIPLYEDQQIAGMFLSQPADEALPGVIEAARQHGVMLVSPFQGDVEAGVAGGISITDRVLPYLNMAALRACQIELKPFFLRVAKRYE